MLNRRFGKFLGFPVVLLRHRRVCRVTHTGQGCRRQVYPHGLPARVGDPADAGQRLRRADQRSGRLTVMTTGGRRGRTARRRVGASPNDRTQQLSSQHDRFAPEPHATDSWRDTPELQGCRATRTATGPRLRVVDRERGRSGGTSASVAPMPLYGRCLRARRRRTASVPG
jgi:hypothetical protein